MAIDATAATNASPQPYRLAYNAKYEGQRLYTFDETLDMFDFWDVVDIINPLQHIPIIGSIYRELTGDEITSFASVAGGALFGGGVGAAFGVANALVMETTGKDPGQLAWAAVFSDDDQVSPVAPGAETLAAADLDAPLGDDLLASTMTGESAPAVATAFTGVTNPGGTGPVAGGPESLAAAGYTAPLGGLFLADDATARLMASSDQVAAERAQAMARATTTVPTLSSAQSAALAAFAAHHAGGPSPRNDGPHRVASAVPGGTVGAEMASRAGVPPAAATDPGGQGHTMTQDETPTMQHGQDQDTSRNSNQDSRHASAPVPADIQRGRDALRARLAASRAEAPVSGGPDQGLGAAAAQASASGVDTASRPSGRTLADYRRRPVTPAVDAGGGRHRTPASSDRGSAINTGDAAAVARLLPEPATMARVLQRGGTVTNAIAEQAQRVAEGVGESVAPGPITGGYPRPDAFRAMPLDTAATETTRPAGESETAPVIAQPWFSTQVMDAMHRYEAMRATAEPAT